jgi:hypothetical protein
MELPIIVSLSSDTVIFTKNCFEFLSFSNIMYLFELWARVTKLKENQ